MLRQSLSQKSKIFASSLYTREPWALPRQKVFRSQKCMRTALLPSSYFLEEEGCGVGGIHTIATMLRYEMSPRIKRGTSAGKLRSGPADG